MQRTFVAGLLAWALWPVPCARADLEPPDIIGLIEQEAKRQGLSHHVALAVADDESGLQNVVGDLHRPDPRKRAYGPFQLQARFHLLKGEKPQKLLHLPTNISRGIAAIKRTLELARGDMLKARFMYVCGRKFLKGCSSKRLAEIKESWAHVWQRWRPRALVLSAPDSLCYAPRQRKGDLITWPQRKNPKTLSARWSPPVKATRRSSAASRTASS